MLVVRGGLFTARVPEKRTFQRLKTRTWPSFWPLRPWRRHAEVVRRERLAQAALNQSSGEPAAFLRRQPGGECRGHIDMRPLQRN